MCKMVLVILLALESCMTIKNTGCMFVAVVSIVATKSFPVGDANVSALASAQVPGSCPRIYSPRHAVTSG